MRELSIGDRVKVVKIIGFGGRDFDFIGIEGTVIDITPHDEQNHRVKLDNLPEHYGRELSELNYGGIWFETNDTITLKEAV